MSCLTTHGYCQTMPTERPRCDEPGDAEVFGLLSAIPVEGEGLEPLDRHAQDGEETEEGWEENLLEVALD